MFYNQFLNIMFQEGSSDSEQTVEHTTRMGVEMKGER
jgi:hypothetical protein